MSNLTSESLTFLAAGATLEDEFDVASTNDLSEGGTVTIHTEGQVHFVTDGAVSGTMPFSSNELTIDIDAVEAKTVSKAIRPLTYPIRTQLSCSPERQAIMNKALSNAVKLANAAADTALSGDAAQFKYFFKTTSPEARQKVSSRFRGVAREAASQTKISNTTAPTCTQRRTTARRIF